MFDIIFLSYDEPHADMSWDLFRLTKPWAFRVHNVKGIYNAHKEAATLARTEMFWVVDADNAPLQEFDFSFSPTANRDLIHVWYAYNPVNNLTYGFGGLKLFPRKKFLKTKSTGIDMSTSLFDGIEVIPEVASITHFNSSPFTAWRSAFRENVKLFLNLTNGNEEDNSYRMHGWLTAIQGVDFGIYSIEGAQDGQTFAFINKDNPDQLVKINDYKWLTQIFEERYGSQ